MFYNLYVICCCLFTFCKCTKSISFIIFSYSSMMFIDFFFFRLSTWEPLDPSIATASSTQWRRPTVWWAWRKAGPNAVSVLSFAPWWWNVLFIGKNDIFLIFSFKASAFDFLDAPVERVTGRDIPMPYAINLETKTIPQTENIVNAAKRVCAGMKKK